MSDGTTFGIDIVAPGDSAETAADAVDRLATKLQAAKTATTESTAATRAAEQAYRQAETVADRAAKAVEKIGVSLDTQRNKMKAAMDAGDARGFWRAAQAIENLNIKQTEAVAKAAAAKGALESAAAGVDKLRSSAAAAAAAEEALAKSLQAAKTQAANQAKVQSAAEAQAKSLAASQAKAAQAAAAARKKEAEQADATARGTGNLGKAGNELAGLGGPLGALAQKVLGVADGFGDVKEALGSGGGYVAIAVAIVAIVTAVLSLTAAAAAGVAKITAWAVSLADAARTQRLFADGVAQSVAGGAELDAALSRLANRVVPQTREELLQMAADLAKTGLRGKELTDELEKTAIKAAEAKFGPNFRKELNSLPQLAARARANFSTLFSGLKIEKLLEGFSRLVGLLDSTSVTGRAIKVVFESLFQPLVDGVVSWIPKMEKAFIQFEILVMKGMIAIKPFGSTLLEVGKVIGIVAAVMAVLTVGFAAAVIAPFAIAAGLIGAVVYAMYQFASSVYSALASAYAFGQGIRDSVMSAIQWLQSTSLSGIGMALIDGLVSGITGAAGKVVAAMTGAVGGAIGAAKSLLGIASPSKVFAEIGQQTGAGMAAGVDASTSNVQGSLEAMVAPPAPAAIAAGMASSTSSSSGPLAGVRDIIFQGVKDGEDALDRLLAYVEGDLTQLGGAAPDAP